MKTVLAAIGLVVIGGSWLFTAATPSAAQTTATVAQCAQAAEADCANVSGCVWLPGYRVAGGVEVKGYCRPAPKPLNARSAAPKPQ